MIYEHSIIVYPQQI